MARLLVTAVLFLAAAGYPVAANAQLGEAIDVAGAAPVLLTSPTVQKDLGLSADQIAKGRQLAQDYQGETMRFALSAVGNPLDLVKLTPAERDAKLKDVKAKAQQFGKTLGEKYKPKAAALLTPEQTKRLQQIAWQIMGTAALSDPQLSDGLALTDNQKTELAEAVKSFNEKQAAAVTKAAGDPKAALAAVQGNVKERDGAMTKVLSPEQNTKYQSLLGKRIEVTAIIQEMTAGLAPARPGK
jgi:Spy/CpxP family protein refolding chaperone